MPKQSINSSIDAVVSPEPTEAPEPTDVTDLPPQPLRPPSMPKQSTDSSIEPTVPPAATNDVALDNWCENKSQSMGRRVEALSAFYRRCQKTGVGRATPEQFDADFQAFLKLPA